jgi:hypothetical protein
MIDQAVQFGRIRLNRSPLIEGECHSPSAERAGDRYFHGAPRISFDSGRDELAVLVRLENMVQVLFESCLDIIGVSGDDNRDAGVAGAARSQSRSDINDTYSSPRSS